MSQGMSPSPQVPEKPDDRSLLPVICGAVAFVVVVIAFLWWQRYDKPKPVVVNQPASQIEVDQKGNARPSKQETSLDVEAEEPAGIDQAPKTEPDQASTDQEPAPKHRPVLSRVEGPPRLAIVIDDWGYPTAVANDFLRLKVPLTIAVIPHLAATHTHASAAVNAGFDVLIHLPMEPLNSRLKTEGMITTQMSDQRIEETVRAALDALPEAVGINNHMGSKATASRRVMQTVLGVVGQAKMIYLDSRTTPDSWGAATALEMGVRTLENAAFIDGQADEAYIRKRLLQVAHDAQERGVAVAIGHVRPATVRALTATLPDIEAMGVQLVRVSDLVPQTTSVPQGTPSAPDAGPPTLVEPATDDPQKSVTEDPQKEVDANTRSQQEIHLSEQNQGT